MNPLVLFDLSISSRCYKPDYAPTARVGRRLIRRGVTVSAAPIRPPTKSNIIMREKNTRHCALLHVFQISRLFTHKGGKRTREARLTARAKISERQV